MSRRDPPNLSWLTPFLMTLALLAGASAIGRAQPALPAKDSPRIVEGELLVKYRGGLDSPAAARVQQTFKHQVKRHFDQIGWQHIQIAAGVTDAAALVRYRQHPDVLAVEPNYVFHLRGIQTNAAMPDDPRFSEQWGLARIGATNAWALTTGSSNVVVAVLDTGLRYTHEDLAANMWRNPGEIPGNGIDDDGNGYIDDVYGIDAVNHDSDPMDQPIGFTFHGTACGSIIGAVGNNEIGMTGLNWPIRLMALRLAATSNYIASAWVLECFNYVVAMKNRGINIRVTSNSYGIDEAPSMAVRDAIDAAGNVGILNVFSAGNSSTNVDLTCDNPICFQLPSMINVAASDEMDALAFFSNYGVTNVDLAAPGVNILVADGIATNGYNPIFTGTSAACPHVAGAAALLAAAYPFATISQIKSALLSAVDVLPAFTNKVRSQGRLNVARAIHETILSTNAPPVIHRSLQSQTVGVGYSAIWRVIATAADPTDYFWKFNDAHLTHTTEPALTLSSVSLQNSGNYAVVLSNAFGMATSVVATLTVVTEPTILAQPQGMRVADRTNITLAIAAAGAFPLAYQWRRDSHDLAGATNTCLALTNTDSTMSGDYQVVLSNAYGIRTSDVARVTVLTRPHIVMQPQSQTVAAGSNVALSVTVTNTATLPIGFRWLRNGLTVNVVTLNEFSAVTNFLNIQTNVAGRWSVWASNEGPNGIVNVISSNAYLTVVWPPTNQTATIGSNVTLTALAVGTAPIRYQWQRGGTNLANAASPSLLLTNVQPADAGTYSVVVTNAIGEPAGFAATLSVLAPSPILTEPRRLSDGTVEIVLRQLVNQQSYTMEISSNLVDWTTLERFSAAGPTKVFTDATAIEANQRFYRVRWNP
jgi:subtilisin family serine protease